MALDNGAGLENTQGKEQLTVERRSPERLRRELYLRTQQDWLSSLDTRAENGTIGKEEKNRIIALAFLKRERKIEEANKKNALDGLTGLYRQEHLRPEIEKRIKLGQPFALLFTDLDHFREINKEYGQPAGDEVIVQAALRITEQLRGGYEDAKSEDIPFRNGGDETAIILPGIDSIESLRLVADKIRVSMESAPFHIPFSSKQIPLTVSIGGSIWKGETMEELLDKAGQQLIEAKKGRNNTHV
ncbi:MAG: GGDEF domain-containing protein [Candidatus Levybacteria bacterium]|nr:GGDEF domain-containing protein [Candidatus Levybacteria bacterium]